MRSSAAVAMLGVALSAAACHHPDAYTLTAPNVASVLTLDAPDSVPADNFSRITLTAKITPEATAGNRTITFSTTAGTLIAGGQQSTTSVDVTADSTGTAVAQLQSGGVPLTCTVQAKVKDKDLLVTKQVQFTAPNPDTILTFTVSPARIGADGFSRARLTATIQQPRDASQRTVAFKTTAGTLFGADQNGPLVNVTADTTGVALAELQSSVNAETAFLSATAAGFTRTATVAFDPVDPASIITLTPSATSAPADGQTLVQVTGNVAPGLKTRSVTFTTTDGTFSNGQKLIAVTADSSNRATVDLKSPVLPAIVDVRATVSSFSAATAITYAQALPETILISPASPQISSTGTDTINVSLFRSIGVPSAGLVVTYSARDASDNPVGGFGGITPTNSSQGAASATSSAVFNPGGTSYRGTVTIQVTVGSVTQTATITITQ